MEYEAGSIADTLVKEGRAEGMAKGMSEGERATSTFVVRNMHEKGLDAQEISDLTGFSLEQVREILSELD